MGMVSHFGQPPRGGSWTQELSLSSCAYRAERGYCVLGWTLSKKRFFLRHLRGLGEPLHSGTERDLQQDLPGQDAGPEHDLSLGQALGFVPI